MDLAQWITTGGSLAAVAGVIATYIKVQPQMKLAQTQADGPLWARIAALEQRLEDERDSCDERIAGLEAQVQVMRHERNNEQQGRAALFAMLRQIDHPEIPKIVATVEDMIARGEQVIATEKAAIPGLKGRIRK